MDDLVDYDSLDDEEAGGEKNGLGDIVKEIMDELSPEEYFKAFSHLCYGILFLLMEVSILKVH